MINSTGDLGRDYYAGTILEDLYKEYEETYLHIEDNPTLSFEEWKRMNAIVIPSSK